MRQSPVPADRQSLVKPEGAEVKQGSSPKPPCPPPKAAASPPRSPQPPPRPLSIKGSIPPLRPPPPVKKTFDAEIIIDFPPHLSPSAEVKGFVPKRVSSASSTSSQSSSPADKSRGSVRSSKTYNPELNPFGDDMEEEEDDSANEDKTDTAPLVSGQLTTPPNRPSLNPFFVASVKKKATPNPPKEVVQQRSVTDIDKRSSGTNLEHQRSGSGIDTQRSGSGTAKSGLAAGSGGQMGNEGTESGEGSQFDPTGTSGSANDGATSVSDASLVVIVSVCLT